MAKKLPRPDSAELKSLGFSAFERSIYKLLHKNRGRPLTMQEIRKALNVRPESRST